MSSGFEFQQAQLHLITVNYCNVNLVVAIAAAWQIRALLFISIVAHGGEPHKYHRSDSTVPKADSSIGHKTDAPCVS